MKKGFTLIELLAVIVILAIIALIATPIVLNIINDTKESAVLRSAEFYLDAVELSIAQRILDGNTLPDGAFPIMEDGNICIKLGEDECEDIMTVEVSKGAPTSGTIAFGEGKVAGVINLLIDNNYLYMNDEGNIEHMVYTEFTDDNSYVDCNYTIGADFDVCIEDETVVVSMILENSLELIVPSKINGKTVVGFADGYANNNIILPDTTKILIRNGIQTESKIVILPSGMEYITQGGINAPNAEHIYLNEGLKYIDGYVYSNVLTKLTIPSTVTDIGYESSDVLKDLPNLTTIVNRTDRAFDWNGIIGGTSGEPFKYGTATRSDGTVVSIIKG